MKIKDENDLDFAMKRFQSLKSKLLNKESKAESHFELLLKKAGFYFIREKANLKIGTNWSYFDFYIPKYRLYIEIDGKEHQLKENKIKDKEKKEFVKRKNRFLIRISNEECLSLTSIDYDFLLSRIIQRNTPEHSKIALKRFKDTIKYKIKEQTTSYNCIKNKPYDGEVYLYYHMTGQFYKFESVLDCFLSTNLSPEMIYKLIYTDYKPSKSRLYVASETMEKCEVNTIITYE